MPYLPYKGLIPTFTTWEYVTPCRIHMGNRYILTTRFPTLNGINTGLIIVKPTKRDMRLVSCLNRQAERVGLAGKDWSEDANKWLLDTLLGTVPNKLWFTSLLRQSEDDPTKVAYTERKRDGTYRHVKTTLAKWLGRNCPDLPESKRKNIHENYILFAHPTPSGLVISFTDNADVMERVYTYSSVESCMGHDAYHFQSPFHPVRIYAAGDLELAYHTDEDGEIDGRGICRKGTKNYVRWYGGGEPAMAKLGYTQDRGCLNGARVTITYGEDDAHGRIVASYIDGEYEWVSIDSEDVGRIGNCGEYGDDYYYCQTATSDQHGYSCPEGVSDGYSLDDDDYVTTYYDERILREDAVLVNGEWYHRDSCDVVFSGYHGEWYLRDLVAHCEDVDDYVETCDTQNVYRVWNGYLDEVTVTDRVDTTEVIGLEYPMWGDHLDRAVDRGLVIKVGDDYYDADSDEIVETANAGWARESDCFEFGVGCRYTSDSLVDEDAWTVRNGELTRDDGVPLIDLVNKTVREAVAEADKANWALAFAHRGSISPMVDHVTAKLKPFRRFLVSIIDGDFTALGDALNAEIRYVTAHHSTNVATWTAQRNHRDAA